MRHEAPMESELMRDLLALVEHMASVGTEDELARQPGKILITTRGPAWVVEAFDVNKERSIRVVGFTLDGTLALVNGLLRLSDPPWSPCSKVRCRV